MELQDGTGTYWHRLSIQSLRTLCSKGFSTPCCKNTGTAEADHAELCVQLVTASNGCLQWGIRSERPPYRL